MNKNELVDAIALEAGISKADAKVALNAFMQVTINTLSQGEDVSILDFGAFKVTERKARMGINPKTKERIQIPARHVVNFKPSAKMANSVRENNA